MTATFFVQKHRPRGVLANTVWSVRPLNRLAGSQNFAQFSPDAGQIAFTSRASAKDPTQIYIESVASGNVERLTADNGDETRPSWSPDGKQIAFVRSSTAPVSKELEILDVASGTRRPVLALDEPDVWLCLNPRISWGRDGRSLVTTARVPGTQTCSLIVVDLETHVVRRLTAPPTSILGDLEAAVSPSGDSVAFVRTFTFRQSDLFIVPFDGGTERRISSDRQDILGFAWNTNLNTASNPGQPGLLTASHRIAATASCGCGE